MNQAPSAKSLTPDQEGPLTAGSTIIWTGNAYDPDGDKLFYQFWLNGPMTGNTWKPMTSWNENNTWNWTTSPIDSGVNIIDMRVRDGRHAAPWGYDSHISAEYSINNIVGIGGSTGTNSKPSLMSVKSDRQSPQDKGVKVTWTAKGSDPDKDTILYQYVLKGTFNRRAMVAYDSLDHKQCLDMGYGSVKGWHIHDRSQDKRWIPCRCREFR